MLVKAGVLSQDAENSGLTLDHLEANPMQQVHGHSITYRIAIGPQQGKKVFSLQTLLPRQDEADRFSPVAKSDGFSLHADVAVRPHDRKKLEQLCRYVARPAVSEQWLALTRDGRVRYALKTPYRDGTTHIIFEPLDFMYRMYGMPWAQGCAGAAMARLAALVPKPRVNLTRFHGVFAPRRKMLLHFLHTVHPGGHNSQHRMTITPAKLGKGARQQGTTEPDDRSPMEQRADNVGTRTGGLTSKTTYQGRCGHRDCRAAFGCRLGKRGFCAPVARGFRGKAGISSASSFEKCRKWQTKAYQLQARQNRNAGLFFLSS